MNSQTRILITGASRGLGRFLADHFLAQGHLVVGAARGEGTIENEKYQHVQADVTDESSVKALMNLVRERLGGLDVLINNAGVARMLPVALTPPATAKKILDVNFLGTFSLSHSAIRLLRKSPHGRIVNFTTVAVPLRLEGEAVYAASKAAVESFTRVLAKELGPMGITCNAIGPSADSHRSDSQRSRGQTAGVDFATGDRKMGGAGRCCEPG